MFALLLAIVPAAFAQSACSQSGTYEQFTTTFVNDTHTDITLQLLDYNCVAQPGTVISAGGSFELNTSDGHEFVFRNPNGDDLLTYMMSTLIAGTDVSIKQTIAEGAAVGPQFELVNPAREALGFAPIYFSDALYNAAQQAAEQFESDMAAAGTNIGDIRDGADLAPLETLLWQYGGEQNLALVGSASGVRFGELASVETLAGIITSSIQEGGVGSNWLISSAQSFAVYADEHVFMYVFSSKTQPELDAALSDEGSADAGTRVDSPVTLTGELSSDEAMDTYSFEAQANDHFAIYMRADFDAYLHLYDANNVEVAFDDDSGDGTNALLLFVAPAAGVYTIGADSLEDGASGQYTLALTFATMAARNFITAARTTTSQMYDLVEGVTYYFSAESADFDTVLFVNDPNGVEIARDDDSGNGTNSVVVFTAPSTGAYSVSVTNFNTTSAVGRYTLEGGGFASAQ